MTLIDLSHPIRHGMTTYPGLPTPEIGAHLTHEDSRAHYGPGTEFHIGLVTMVGNTGTYVDSPFHRHRDMVDIAGVSLASYADLDGIRINSQEQTVGPDAFAGLELAGRAVLIHTGWARHWGTDAYYAGHTYLTRAAAEALVGAGVALVGIDTFNIDDTADPARSVHTVLLAAGIPIIEHLRGLDELPEHGFRFHAVPPPIVGMSSFPVRAYAVLDT